MLEDMDAGTNKWTIHQSSELSSRHTHAPLQLFGCGSGVYMGGIWAAVLPPAFGPLLVGSSAGSAGMGWTFAKHSSLQCTFSWPTCVRGKARTVHAAYQRRTPSCHCLFSL